MKTILRFIILLLVAPLVAVAFFFLFPASLLLMFARMLRDETNI